MITFLTGFFEEMDEMVYISDLETYEIVYMNRRLREATGCESADDYRGKRCYQVLQGRTSPCAFCTNACLQQGQFFSWVLKNPVLNKRFLIKDTVLLWNGRQYRVEIAVDMDAHMTMDTPYFYAQSESILNECLQQVFSTTNPEESLRRILAYIGKTFACDRAYVFEISDHTANNTYEWCNTGVMRQQEILQDIALSDLACWMKMFRDKKVVTISDLEEVRTNCPSIYAMLKPQQVRRLAAGPIVIEDRVVGFIGADNPGEEKFHLLRSLMQVIGYFIVSLLKRRDLLNRLNALSFQDVLTGAFNRNAMFERYEAPWPGTSLGVIYCDVTGLKQTNDTMGHGIGDQLLQHCYTLIRDTLRIPTIFRAGGDEFVAVFQDVEQQEFMERFQRLQQGIREDRHHIAVGYAWSDKPPLRLEDLISQADRVMYRDKRQYYEANCRVPGIDRRNGSASDEGARVDSLFYQFMNTTYCDMEMFFNAISQQNTTSYFYFGDMQKDLFYISDNMRDEFGFQSNVVPGLLQDWAKRITTPRAREMYWRELESMLQEKRSIHDLRYQVRTAEGRNIWIRCYGVLKWNEDKSVPLFFSGRVTHQDEEFVVDPVTNFPREATMFRMLDEVRKNGVPVLAIGFNFNNITEINSTRGRMYSDNLVRSISEELAEKLSDKMSFFRLEGMRCVAIVDPACKDTKEELVAQIRKIISRRYHAIGIAFQRSCAFAVMEYLKADIMPADFLEQMVSLIKIAKHEVNQDFLEYTDSNIDKTRQLSNLALTLSQDVLHGMKHFRIVIQPVVSSKSGAVLGGETLLRWQFDGKDVSPDIFIPLLEKNNMIHLAGRWVFEQAVRTCLRLHSYDPEFYLTFNVSLQQMSDERLPDFMEQILAKYHLRGACLVAEVTESCMDEQPERLLRFVQVCNRNGIRIALDDFGSGYSSFRMLLQYPSDIIKLDRSLLREMTESDDKMNFISSMVYACHRFGKQVCMEGVETAEQNTLIQESGCDMIQGYYYYRPMEVDQIYQLLSVQPPQDESGQGNTRM